MYLEVREREIQWDRITGVCRAGIIWEINRSSGEMEVETPHKTLLGSLGRGIGGQGHLEAVSWDGLGSRNSRGAGGALPSTQNYQEILTILHLDC